MSIPNGWKKAGQNLSSRTYRMKPHFKASGILNVVTPEIAVQLIKDYVAEVPIQRFYTWTLSPG
jgi:hypothetical protein